MKGSWVPTKKYVTVNNSGGPGSAAFTDLTDVPASYVGQSGKVAAVKATEDGIEFVAVGGTGTVTSVASADGSITVTNPSSTPDLAVVKAPKLSTGRTISTTGDVTYTSPSFDGSANVSGAATIANSAVTLAKMADMATSSLIYRKTAGTGVPEVNTLATLKTDLGLAGTNSGDQTSIVGITGTKAQFNTAVTDGDILYVGDVTQYTDENAQDAVGAMVDTTLVYTDATPLLSRAALTGAVTASAGSNTTSLGSFTKAQLDTAVSDGNVLYVGDVTSNATHTGEVTGSTTLTVDPTAITNKTTVTAVGSDYVLISDTSDSGLLKKALVSDFIGGTASTDYSQWALLGGFY